MELLKAYVSRRREAGSAARLADQRHALVDMEDLVRAKDAELARRADEERRLTARLLELERRVKELEEALANGAGGRAQRPAEHELQARAHATLPSVAPELSLALPPVTCVDSSCDANPCWICILEADLRSLTQEQEAMQTEIVRAAAQVTALDRVREHAVREGGLLRAELAAPSRPARRDHRLQGPPVDVSPPREPLDAPRPPPSAPQLITKIDGARLSYPLHDGDMTIGRSKHCDICIASDFVSRVHATLSTRGSTILIVDANSTNGIFVNSVRVHRHELRDGDVVSLAGQLDLSFVGGKGCTEAVESSS